LRELVSPPLEVIVITSPSAHGSSTASGFAAHTRANCAAVPLVLDHRRHDPGDVDHLLAERQWRG
jgi:hypothetical protein